MVSMKAKTAGTTIYRLRHDVYDDFLHPSKLKDWHEKEVESKFPTQVRFDSASKKVKEQVFSNMFLKVFEPNDMILQAGTMPKDLIFLISGKIALYQRPSEDINHINPNLFVVQSTVGPRKQ